MAQVSKAETAPFTPTKMTPVHSSSAHFRWTTGRWRLSFRRRTKLPTVRLGGAGGKKPRRRFFLVRPWRRVKLRALKHKYICMVKKLKDYYGGLVKELMEAGGAMEPFQQRILIETSFAVPVMGLSFNSFPNNYALDHHRSVSTHPPHHLLHHHV